MLPKQAVLSEGPDPETKGVDEPIDFPDLSTQSIAWEDNPAQNDSVPVRTEPGATVPDDESVSPEDHEKTIQAELETLLSETCCRCGKTIQAAAVFGTDGEKYCGTCGRSPSTAGETPPSIPLDEASVGAALSLSLEKPAIPAYSLGTEFGVTAVLKEAWAMVSGAKGPIWGGIIAMLFILLGVETAAVILVPSVGSAGGGAVAVWVNLIIQIIGMVLSITLLAGLLNIGVRRVAGTPFSWKTVYSGFTVFGQLAVAGFLMSLLIVSGFFLLVLPGIYLAVGYSLTLPLILDKGYGPWEAMEASRRIIHRKWWQVFIIYLVMYLIYMLSSVPLGIGMIWTIPMFFTLTGVFYRGLVPDKIPG